MIRRFVAVTAKRFFIFKINKTVICEKLTIGIVKILHYNF